MPGRSSKITHVYPFIIHLYGDVLKVGYPQIIQIIQIIKLDHLSIESDGDLGIHQDLRNHYINRIHGSKYLLGKYLGTGNDFGG